MKVFYKKLLIYYFIAAVKLLAWNMTYKYLCSEDHLYSLSFGRDYCAVSIINANIIFIQSGDNNDKSECISLIPNRSMTAVSK